MRHWILILLLLVSVAFAPGASASSALDKLYRLRNLTAFVVNTEQEPVFGRYVEKLFLDALENSRQFELSVTGYRGIADIFKQSTDRRLSDLKNSQMEPYIRSFRALADKGLDGVILIELETGERTQINAMLVSLVSLQVLHETKVQVENQNRLESYKIAAQRSFESIARAIPFDTEILSREGYRVVLGYGGPRLSRGTILSTYTLEQTGAHVHMEETGLIVLTEVGEKLSFGQITVERKPFEVTKLNKVHIPSIPKAPGGVFLPNFEENGSRQIASLPGMAQETAQFGSVRIAAGANLVNFANTRSGQTASSANNFFPGARAEGELWLTRNVFLDLGFSFAMATIGIPDRNVTGLNSNVNGIKVLMAYRLPFNQTSLPPALHLKVGYGRQQYQVDPNADSLSFRASTYSGLLAGAIVKFPISQRYGIHFDVEALLLGSLKETPTPSGADRHTTTGWEFSLGSYYSFTENISLTGSLFFHSNRAEFGEDTTFASTSQSIRAFMAGLSYAF